MMLALAAGNAITGDKRRGTAEASRSGMEITNLGCRGGAGS